MNVQANPADLAHLESRPATADPDPVAAARAALRRIAPLWPLDRFVAVNPFLGLDSHPFAQAAGRMAQVAGARMFMDRPFFAAAVESGRITDPDLADALAATHGTGLPASVAEIKKALAEGHGTSEIRPIATVAEIAAGATGTDWPRIVVQQLSTCAAAHFAEDEPSGSFYAVWREVASADRTAEIHGLTSARRHAAHLPQAPEDLVREAVLLLGIEPAGVELYCHRLLMTVSGWAGYARHLLWEAELKGRHSDHLFELLAARLGWEVILRGALFANVDVTAQWAETRRSYADGPSIGEPAALDLVLLSAYERAWQRRFARTLAAAPRTESPAAGRRPAVQAAFCIDVRSEVFRRALETVSPDIDTLGFAGFFGLPLEHVPLGSDEGLPRCPVLLAPTTVIREASPTPAESAAVGRARQVRRGVAQAIARVRRTAAGSFPFVELSGLGFAAKLVTDSLGLTRPVADPVGAGLLGPVRGRTRPEIDPPVAGGRHTGIAGADRVAIAQAILTGMSLTGGFARVVLLVGHGASTVNNPHARGLDCGACGGQSGDVNARVAAALLNDADVRKGLAQRGIRVPQDTVFVAGLHDTTTDAVTLFDADRQAPEHLDDLARLKEQLASAGRIARLERAPSLKLQDGGDVDRSLRARARDWSQVRPEWGLAGCTAFVAAPRTRTAGMDLKGQVFLHSYDWQSDTDFRILELIMTAPMIVASWINLQYYGSSVDNRVFGSGNKTLHNVVGTIGVMEGNGGDLRVGLPLQSVHDGDRLVHDPMRLSVYLEAPQQAIDRIVARHETVRRLVDNGWIFLFSIDPEGRVARRSTGQPRWEPVAV
ncbi:DUF2309 domain-containing protein [Thalassobaculum sp. OXR-137]|uniref:YbcC family protein n=1 Tax=Thalassobaculum sp. OXR-137 TaxID=3100173 RepID=UPI002AC9DC33|nr:DUF2309 domain-containing protein [Thalassobaculum sp. OXR-137]WPZ32371.1 DUF2309 domain-containing protein [Thalassobaculum sp. OXR-137]